MKPNKQAFTLIELLVVVLIIGILAAVAAPQYQKAVEKSRVATIYPLLKSIGEAQESYYLANGEYATSLNKLSIDVPLTGSTKGVTHSALIDVRSNNDWSLQLYPTINAVIASRLTGSYAGAAIAYYYGQWGCEGSGHSCVRPHTFTCLVKETVAGGVSSGQEEVYCSKLLRATEQVQSGGIGKFYAIP